jgi:hypothetical protein
MSREHDDVPDVEILCGVRARELRFGTVPEAKLSFEGEPGVSSSTRTERGNLPDRVEPQVTYRNVTVRWRARARIIHPSEL